MLPTRNLWQDILSMALQWMLRWVSQIPPLCHSFPTLSRMPPAAGSQLSSSSGTALGQTSSRPRLHPLLEGCVHPMTGCSQGLAPCLNSGPLSKANPLRHLHANLHLRACFMNNPTFFQSNRCNP